MSDQAELNPEQAAAGRPDPLFKVLTRLEAEQLGLKAIETEKQFQETTRADLVLVVPPGVDVEGTMFDFFRATNVIEFKSENDPLTLREYLKNETRTTLQFLQSKDLDLDELLNVIVTSRSPDTFLEQAVRRRIFFQPEEGRPWLLRAQVGFQDVAIVVCRDLPLEELYYNWLVFAPSDSRKWRRYIEILLKENREELLAWVKRIRPKELKMVTKDIMDLAIAEGFVPPKYSEAELAEMDQLDEEIALLALEYFNKRKKPTLLRKLLSAIEPEERLAGIKPEELVESLSAEDRQALLKILTEQTKEEN